jgi:hypothetical protein
LKTLKYLLLAIALCMGVSSCNTVHRYPPALFRNDVQLMEKPHSTDEKKTAIYASGSYLVHSNDIVDTSSMITGGMFNVYRSHTISHFNYSYGVMGFMGVYRPDAADDIAKNISFKGFGINTSISYYKNFGNIDWRIAGVDLVYTQESGDYQRFRNTVAPGPYSLVSTQSRLFTVGIFSEIVIKFSKDVRLGGKVFGTETLGPVNREMIVASGFIDMNGVMAYVGYKNLTGHLTLSPLSGSVQLGLTYRF